MSINELFLQTLANTGNLSVACQAAGLSRRKVASIRHQDAIFDRCYDEAMDEAIDRLEAEAWRRALEGIEQPLMQGGRPVRDPETDKIILVRRYSDPLLAMLLRGNRPGKYQVRSSAAAGPDMPTMIREIAADDDPPRKRPSR